MNKIHLFIDTSQSTKCYISIIDLDFNTIESKIFYTQNNLIDLINPELNKLFKKANIEFGHIQKIYLNVGPGVFTGIRVGTSIAKTFKFVFNNIDIYTINALLLKCKGNGISLIDAKSDKWYIGVYENNKEIITPQLIDVNQKREIINKYNHLTIFDESIDIDYKFGLDIFKLFKKQEDYLKLEPLYIKQPI